MRAVGIDIGGTKMLGVVVDATDPTVVLDEVRLPTPYGSDALVDAVAAIVADLDPRGAGPVALGIPGLVDAADVFRYGPNLPGVVDLDVPAAVGGRLERVVRAANDATCATYAEFTGGAAAGVAEGVLLTLGTGIGGGVVTGGVVQHGAHGFAGEPGHMLVDPAGPPCPCGRRGCWERFASGSGLGRLARDAAVAGRLAATVELAGGEPEAVRGEHVVAALRSGDDEAAAVADEFAWWVAAGIANLIDLLDPAVIVLGGGVMAAGDVLLPRIRAAVPDQVMAREHRPPVEIVVARFGEHAGAIGAAVLALGSGAGSWRRRPVTRRPAHGSRCGPVTIVLTAAALAAAAGACSDGTTHTHEGLVVDVTGAPVAEGVVRVGDEEVRTDADGRYEVSVAEEDAWVRVVADGMSPRTRASAAGAPVVVRLSPDPEDTVSIHFTGDAMAGRRFYDRDEDGDTSDGQLSVEPSLDEHRALLSHIEPLLADADLTVVNLETPLTEDPWYDVRGRRPAAFHPTKDFAFSSHPLFARALADAGVDVVDLGNNHLYDRLGEGLADTVRALEEAGIEHYGAGATIEEAWRPALVEREGQTIALLGCTTITGEEHDIVYVATDDQGGAAPCDPDLLQEAVGDAADRADAVVLSIHGGFEYGAEPSDRVAGLTERARQAGARLVVNHHPHVVGGIDQIGSTVVAENMGNFVFDQTIWQTFPGYVFRAELRAGTVVRAYVEPIVVADYRPRGLTAAGAAHVQRIAAGLGGPDAVMEDGAVELDLAGAAATRRARVDLDDAGGGLHRVAPGAEVIDVLGEASRVGRDVLRVGDFEDHHVGADDSHHSFWELQPGREVGDDLGRDGSAGARISRSSGDRSDAFFNPRHRILIGGGSDVTFTGRVRAEDAAEVVAQLSWFPDTKGSSSERATQRIDLGEPDRDGWVPFRLDVTAPVDAVAVGAFVRLRPPDAGRQTVRLDDLALVVWSPSGTPPDSSHDHLDVEGLATVELAVRHLPGGRSWADRVLEGPLVVPVQ